MRERYRAYVMSHESNVTKKEFICLRGASLFREFLQSSPTEHFPFDPVNMMMLKAASASPYLSSYLLVAVLLWRAHHGLLPTVKAFLPSTASRATTRVGRNNLDGQLFVSSNDIDNNAKVGHLDGFFFNDTSLSTLETPPLPSTLEQSSPEITAQAIAQAIQYLQSDMLPRQYPFEKDEYWKHVRQHVTKATTMPPEAFRSAEFYDVEQEKLFAATWQVAAFTEQLQSKGDVVTATVAGQPILVTRAKDGELRAFFNVCRHRGARLVKDKVSCGKKSLACPYHNWGYSLDGRLVGTPLWGKEHKVPDEILAARLEAAGTNKDVQDFDKADYGLLPVRVDTWGPFVYVNVDGQAPPLNEYLGRVTQDLELYPFDDFVTVRQDDLDIKANWKLLAENFMDFYHVPVSITYADKFPSSKKCAYIL